METVTIRKTCARWHQFTTARLVRHPRRVGATRFKHFNLRSGEALEVGVGTRVA